MRVVKGVSDSYLTDRTAKVPLHEFEKAEKNVKRFDIFFTGLMIIVVLAAIGAAVWFVWILLFEMLITTPFFWPVVVVGGGVLATIVIGTAYSYNKDVLEQGKRNGTIDE